MKKRIFVVLAALVFAAAAFAQDANNAQQQQQRQVPEGESEFYYVSVPLEKIYPYNKGYVVTYRKGIDHLVNAYLPQEWFYGTAGKGDLITLRKGDSWPYLTVYYKNGEFHHARLYVHRNPGHITWGNIPIGVNLDKNFENVEDLKLMF